MKASIRHHRHLGALMGLSVTLLATSCIPSGPRDSGYMAGIRQPVARQAPNGPHHPPPAIRDDISYWEGDDVEGSPLIRINIREQKAHFYKGNRLVGVSLISSGKEDKGTPPGRYRITEKSKDHRSNLYGIFRDKATDATINNNVDIRVDPVPPGAYFVPAYMPYFLRFNGAIGMHTGYLPGYPASSGCIRMPNHMAEKFFENSEVGTPVIVE
ncbi:MAG: L,D-transpeptidase family protein [Luteolibacter sp.]